MWSERNVSFAPSSRLFSPLPSCKNSPSREIFLTLHPFPTSIMDTRKLFISSIFIETLHWPGFWSIGREETPLQACRSKAGAPVAAAFSTRSSYFSACRQASRYRLAWKHIVLDHPAPKIHLGSPVPRSSDSRIQRLDFKHRTKGFGERSRWRWVFRADSSWKPGSRARDVHLFPAILCPRDFFARIPIFPAKDLSNSEGLFGSILFLILELEVY